MDLLAALKSTFETLPNAVLAIGIAAAIVIGVLNLGLLFVVLRTLRRAARKQDARADALAEEVKRAPTIAAMAALVIASRKSRTNLLEIEQELVELLDRWEEVETLAQDARARLDQLDSGEDEPARSPSRHSA